MPKYRVAVSVVASVDIIVDSPVPLNTFEEQDQLVLPYANDLRITRGTEHPDANYSVENSTLNEAYIVLTEEVPA